MLNLLLDLLVGLNELILDLLHLALELALVEVNPDHVVVHGPHHGLALVLDSANVLLDSVDDHVLHSGAPLDIGVLDVFESTRPVDVINIVADWLHNEDGCITLVSTDWQVLRQNSGSLKQNCLLELILDLIIGITHDGDQHVEDDDLDNHGGEDEHDHWVGEVV